SWLTVTSAFWSSSNSPASASRVAGIRGVRYHTWLIFVFLVETGFHHVAWVGLKLLTSGDLPALASQHTRSTCVSHHARPKDPFLTGCSSSWSPWTKPWSLLLSLKTQTPCFSRPLLFPDSVPLGM
uniref:Uncharacterized protein n=1 Tax=Macaca fascicularis TaxID=9541 RepID=A0A7N9D9C8_MACFA